MDLRSSLQIRCVRSGEDKGHMTLMLSDESLGKIRLLCDGGTNMDPAVSTHLARAIIQSLTRSGSGQAVQGLGAGRRPSTSVQIYEYEGRPIRTFDLYQRLPADARAQMLAILRGLNQRWGYFGAPPVPETAILDYYFTEEPRGGWPIVIVSHDRRDTNISFYNRAWAPEFRRLCTAGVGTLREHVPSMPPAPTPRP